MPDLTRRRALLTAASSVAALAGCTGEEATSTIDVPPRDRPIEDYEVRHVRDEDGAVLFSQGEELPTITDERSRYGRGGRSTVVSDEALDDLTFGETPEADELASFARATDYDAASLYLLAMPVEACYEIRLQSVTVEGDELANGDLHPHADFCRSFRPADVDCEAGVLHTVGYAIRLPVSAERSTGSGRGMSSSCGPSPRGEYFDATVTPAEGGGDE